MTLVWRWTCSLCALLCILPGAFSSSASAADYPSKLIRLVVPYPPGGAPDTVARRVAQELSIRVGQPVIIDNRVGTSGVVGTESAARSAPDGYTLFLADAGALVINPAIYKNLRFRPVEDFDPISLLVTTPFVLVVHPSLGVSTLEELIAVGKKVISTMAPRATDRCLIWSWSGSSLPPARNSRMSPIKERHRSLQSSRVK